MSGQHPLCAPYILEYKSYLALVNNSKNLVEIIKYGDYQLNHKRLKNIPQVIQNLKLHQQPKLLKKLQKKYISLQSKKKSSLSWKNKSSISLPTSLRINSMSAYPKSITVAGYPRKKSVLRNISYTVSSKKNPSRVNTKRKKKQTTKKKYQTGGSSSPSKKKSVSSSQQPSLTPRKLTIGIEDIPQTPHPKLLGGETFQDEKKKHLRSLFRLDFELPDGRMQKLYFKIGRAPDNISQEVTYSSPLAICRNFQECNPYIYESNIYHILNQKSVGNPIHHNILDIFGYGYTFESSPEFIVKYHSGKQKIVGTHTPLSSKVKEIKLDIPAHIISHIQSLWLDLKNPEEPPIFLSYQITEYCDDYIPLKHSKKLNTENKVVKAILESAGILSSLYNNYGFIHGDLHDQNYLVKDIDISDRNSVKDIPPDFIKFYDFDLSMLVNHHSITIPVEDAWIGNVSFIYSEIYQGLLQNNLLLFGKILSLYDFYRVFCNCSLQHPNRTSIFDFIGMTYFKNLYVEELSESKYEVKHIYFLKVIEQKSCSKDLYTEVLKLSLEFKNDIIDNENNKDMLLERFTPEEYEIIKKLLIDGFPIDPEYFMYTIPWWFTIWCIWTNEKGVFLK